LFRSRTTLAMLLLAAAIGSGAGITLMQAQAGYEIRFIYGEKGANDLLVRLGEKIPAAAKAILPADIAFRSGYTYEFTQAESALSDSLRLAMLLDQPDNQALVIRESYLAHEDYASNLNLPQVKKALHNYRLEQIGSFWFYYR